MASETQKKGPSRPIEKIREELMASPDSKEMAEKLGVSLEDYVEKVLFYVQNPDKEPMFYLADEEQLKAAGEEFPTVEDTKQWLEKVASGEIDLGPMKFKDGFEAGGGPKLETGGSEPAAAPSDPAAGAALREQIQRQLKKAPKS